MVYINTLVPSVLTTNDETVHQQFSQNPQAVLDITFPGSTVSNPDFVRDGRDIVSPLLDPLNGRLPPGNPPADFTSAPGQLDPASFQKWHSAFQVKYVKDRAGNGELTIGSGASAIHVVNAVDGTRAYVIENFTDKNSVTKLPAADVARLQQFPHFITQLSTIGLTVDPGANTPSGDKTSAINSLDDVIKAIEPSDPTAGPGNSATTFARPTGADQMSVDDRKAFLEQVKLLKQKVQANPIISAKDVGDSLQLITDRFRRAAAFATQLTEHLGNRVTFGTTSMEWGYVSDDRNATIKAGYANLIRQENQILKLANAAHAAATGPVPANVDAPTLIFQFQLNANLTQQAQIAADTEEVKQLNALLQSYNKMQNIINHTIKSFAADAKDTDKMSLRNPDNRDGNGHDGTWVSVDGLVSDRIVAMFDGYNASAKQAHPLELLYGISRPQQKMVNNDHGNFPRVYAYDTEYSKAQWTTFGDQLNGAVTQLNQQSQIKTDGINSLTKQKDRHFDLGNNALAKMADMIQSIGRSVA